MLVAGSVNLCLGGTPPRLPHGAERIRATGRSEAGGGRGAHQSLAGLLLALTPAAPGADDAFTDAPAAPLTRALAVHPTA
ncbi:hypothetical protein SSPO_099470 [Streptomyces antimycoticus]|uniref:Carbohydrate kinase PfkB domain-containing protein n=1 Tax=Streptomyces antimycoticus TaxID=68175 RepID=A0A499VE45_9ACTN|nr:hypothetical protein SSPO_099470 [Streptomyces antimycoticus]